MLGRLLLAAVPASSAVQLASAGEVVDAAACAAVAAAILAARWGSSEAEAAHAVELHSWRHDGLDGMAYRDARRLAREHRVPHGHPRRDGEAPGGLRGRWLEIERLSLGLDGIAAAAAFAVGGWLLPDRPGIAAPVFAAAVAAALLGRAGSLLRWTVRRDARARILGRRLARALASDGVLADPAEAVAAMRAARPGRDARFEAVGPAGPAIVSISLDGADLFAVAVSRKDHDHE